MTDPHPTPHRATPEQWRCIEEWAQLPSAEKNGAGSLDSCILELRDTLSLTREALAALERRVGALEGGTINPPFTTPIAPL